MNDEGSDGSLGGWNMFSNLEQEFCSAICKREGWSQLDYGPKFLEGDEDHLVEPAMSCSHFCSHLGWSEAWQVAKGKGLEAARRL